MAATLLQILFPSDFEVFYFGGCIWTLGYVIIAISLVTFFDDLTTQKVHEIFNFKANFKTTILFKTNSIITLLCSVLFLLVIYFQLVDYHKLLFVPEALLLISIGLDTLLSFIYNSLQNDIDKLVNSIELLESNSVIRRNANFEIEEFNLIENFIQRTFIKINNTKAIKAELEKTLLENQIKTINENNKYRELLLKKSSLERISRQENQYRERISLLVHDIKSPTTLINHIAMHMKEKMTVEEMELDSLLVANNKINRLTQHLLNEYKTADVIFNSIYFNVYWAVYRVFQETSTMYHDIKLKYDDLLSDHLIIIYGNVNDFERMLMNLINNAAQAIIDSNGGCVTITLSNITDYIIVSIKDNGMGIPEDTKNKFMQNQEHVSSKDGGSGVGLLQVKQTLKSINATCDIQSEKNLGTEFIIKIPSIQLPNWFCNSIHLELRQNIIVFDDDENIHLLWKNIFAPYIDVLSLNIMCFSQVELLHEYLKQLPNQANILFLCDYDAKSIDGLEFMKDLNIKNSILVTALGEDIEIQKKLAKTEFKLINKQIIPYLKITTSNNEINKQTLANMVWLDDQEFFPEYIINRFYSHLKVDVFNSVREFLEKIYSYDKNILIILDNHIDVDDVIKSTGVSIAKKLYQDGFHKIVIVTSEVNFTGYPDYISVLNKSDLDGLKNLAKIA